MRVTYLDYWIWINVMMCVKGMTKVEYKYFSTGDEITLKCKCKALFWNGPARADTGIGISHVYETDIYDELTAWNVSIYTYGEKVAEALPQKLLRRLHVIGDNFDLHITNLSTSDEGLYMCDPTENCVVIQIRYILQHKLLPKNLEILNITDNNIIKGRANSPLDLICLVKSGKPPEVLRWRKNKIIFKQGGPSELVFSFIPDKTDHQSVYSCEVQNPDMETPFTKTIHLDIAYKPSIKVDIRDRFIVEGKTMHICCNSISNPKPTSISWYTEDTQLVSTNKESSLCYTLSNVSRQDTGNYTCASQNEIGKVLNSTSVFILYPPVVHVLQMSLSEDSSVTEIQCIAQGEPDNYTYSMWEHRSIYKEHIRYLSVEENGVLQLSGINISKSFQDTGFYTCNVSNGIPDYHGNLFQQGTVFLESNGSPVFAADNKHNQDIHIDSSVKIKVNVYSSSKLKCFNITEVDSTSVILTEVETHPVLIKESVYGAIVTLNGTEIIFTLKELNSGGSRLFNITVCNNFGVSSFVVHLKLYSVSIENSKRRTPLTAIIVTTVILTLILAPFFVKFFFMMKEGNNEESVNAINIRTTERYVDDNPHYEEITEDDTILATLQGNNIQMFLEPNRILVENRNMAHLSDEHSSSLSNYDIDVSDDLQDGYENPYTTMVAYDRDEDQHLYLTTTNNATISNSPSPENASSGLFCRSKELGSSLDQTQTHIYENACLENVKLNYVKNLSYESDFQRPDDHNQNETVEYINLSLNQ